MKIKKLVESKLVEADVIDPTKASEVADELQDQSDLSDEAAEKIAKETADIASDFGAESGVIAIDPDLDYEDVEIVNAITEALDEAYEDAKEFSNENEEETSNVLIEGLPGSGKTAIVNAWCRRHGLTLVKFNATDPKLESAINGIPLRDMSAAESNALTYAYARDKVGQLLSDIHPELKNSCVLFVDELNRQKTAQMRRPFMELFNAKCNSDGSLDFRDNLLFSVICINPYGDEFHDTGVGELIPAELNRFLTKMKFDSNKESSIAFFEGWIKDRLLDLGIIPPNSKASERRNGFIGPIKELSAEDLEKAKKYIKRYELAMKILSSDKFRFDERRDANQIWLEKADYLTSRLLTNGLAKSKGDVKKFLNWVDTKSGLSKRVINMFHEILDTYIVDEKELWQEYGLVKSANGAAPVGGTKGTADAGEVEDDDEDFEDSDVAAAGNKTGGATTNDEKDVQSVIDTWDF